MSYTLGVLLAIAPVSLIIISGRQFVLRLVMAALLLAIIGLGFWAKVYMSGNPDPTVTLVVGLGVVVMIVAVMVLALLDLRQVMAVQHRAQAELYERLADMRREIEELTKAKQTEDEAKQDFETKS